MSDAVLLPMLGILGLFAGSFGGMAVNRIPDSGLSLFNPGPRCVRCEHALRIVDIIPIVSWLRLGGRCRHCEQRVTWAYPAMETLMAVLFVIAGIEWGASWVLLPALLVFWTLAVASVTDLYIYAIPNRLTFPMLGITAVVMAVLRFSGAENMGNFRAALIGMLVYFAVLAIPSLIYPAGLGFGDVKLALLMGLFLGYVSPMAVEGIVVIMWALAIGSVLGAIMGIALKVLRSRGIDPLPDPWAEEQRAATEATDASSAEPADGDTVVEAAPKKVKTGFPFGPALAAGCILAALFVEQIVNVGN